MKRLSLLYFLSCLPYVLSAGYIFQYLEQVSSCKIFLHMDSEKFSCQCEDTFWFLFHFKQIDMVFINLFTPLERADPSIRNEMAYSMRADDDLILSPSRSLSKTIFWTCWILGFRNEFVALEFRVLKYTFREYAVFRAFIVFIPLFLFFLAVTNRNGFFSIVLCILSLTFYFNHVVLNLIPSKNYINRCGMIIKE